MEKFVEFNVLEGKILRDVEVVNYNEKIIFKCEDGSEYEMYHEQDCCETVLVDDVCGDWIDIIGDTIEIAEERSNVDESGNYDSATWTFYTLRTVEGSVDIKWLGESNGYYSEGVSFYQTKEVDDRIGRNIKLGSIRFDA